MLAEGCDEVIPRRARVPLGGVDIYVWCPAGWGTRAHHWHLFATFSGAGRLGRRPRWAPTLPSVLGSCPAPGVERLQGRWGA